MDVAVLSTRGRITIPAKIRKEAGLVAGTILDIRKTGHGLVLSRIQG